MFSIIIPLYNKAAYIEKAIQSVLAQTFKEFELIIVDDGSTDDSLEKLKVLSSEFRVEDSFEFGVLSFESNSIASGKRVRVFQQNNQGVSTARNNGVKQAKYDFIAFLDADDWWEPTYLEELKKLIEEYPEAGLYGSSYFKVKNGQDIPANIGVEKGFKRGIINYYAVYARTMYMPLWPGSTIIKKACFQEVNGFKPQLKGGEDFDLWVRVVEKYPVAFLNKPLAYYNQDVELQGRAVGARFYKPEQHMIFTDYGHLHNNPDFQFLFEVLALYSLLPYYLADENEKEVKLILKKVHWKNHPIKYRFYYLILPKWMLKLWFAAIKSASEIKNKILK